VPKSEIVSSSSSSTPSSSASTATQVSYSNTTSGLTATNVQGAIDELASDDSKLKPIAYDIYQSIKSSFPSNPISSSTDTYTFTDDE